MLIESIPREPLSFHLIPFDCPRVQYTLQVGQHGSISHLTDFIIIYTQFKSFVMQCMFYTCMHIYRWIRLMEFKDILVNMLISFRYELHIFMVSFIALMLLVKC